MEPVSTGSFDRISITACPLISRHLIFLSSRAVIKFSKLKSIFWASYGKSPVPLGIGSMSFGNFQFFQYREPGKSL